MRKMIFNSKYNILALSIAGLLASSAPSFAACGWVKDTNDFLCDQANPSANGPNSATVAIETTRAVAGITANGNALASPPIFLSIGGGAVSTPQTAITMTQQMTDIANLMAQLGLNFQVIIDAMVPMTEEERAAFMAAVAAMTAVQMIATFGG